MIPNDPEQPASDTQAGLTHTPGPWEWYGSTDHYPRFHLATVYGGRRFVMGFKRAGMQGAEPVFQVNNRMVPASELVLFDVDPSVKGVTAGRAAESVYRQDFSVIDHPDARLIAAAPDILAALTRLTEELELVARVAGSSELAAVAEVGRAAIAKAKATTP